MMYLQMARPGQETRIRGWAGFFSVSRHSLIDVRESEFQVQSEKAGNYLITFKASDCAWGMGVFVLGLGLNLYTVGEVVASVMISSIMILTLGLTLTSMLFIWHAVKSIASWRRVASRNTTLLTCLTAELARPQTTE